MYATKEEQRGSVFSYYPHGTSAFHPVSPKVPKNTTIPNEPVQSPHEVWKTSPSATVSEPGPWSSPANINSPIKPEQASRTNAASDLHSTSHWQKANQEAISSPAQTTPVRSLRFLFKQNNQGMRYNPYQQSQNFNQGYNSHLVCTEMPPTGYAVSPSCTTAPKTATATASIITNAAVLAQQPLLLKSPHQTQVTAVKTIPVSSILPTSSAQAHINYQSQPVTLAFIQPAEPGQLLTNLLLKQNREQPVSSPTTPSTTAETLHYVRVSGRNIYVPAQPSFHIPVSSGEFNFVFERNGIDFVD